MPLFDELKRRNVFRIAIAYVVLAWLMAQVAELLLGTFGAPDWVLKTLLMVFMIGFPFALFFAWAFELTPDGLKKEKDVDRSRSVTATTGRKLDRAIIAILVLALGYFAWDKFMNRPEQLAEPVQIAAENVPEAPPGPVLPTDKSIAVLPFDNRSNAEEDEFFTSGIHDDLLTQLAQVSSLRVISRTSVGQFKDTTKSIREIAEILGVSTILEGGVQRAGNQVRINMQLIDAATDAHLWAETFDRELTASNIFRIQSEIATAVTEAMRATLSPEEQQRISSVPTENMQALEEYFKGRAEMDQRTVPAIESARLRFEHARELDPDFALAYAGEAQAILLLADTSSSYGDIPPMEAARLARPLLQRALELAPRDAQVLGVSGLLESQVHNEELALDFFARSLKLNPSSGEVLNWQRSSQFAVGQIRESMETNLRMMEIDPMSMITLYNGLLGVARTEGHDVSRVEMMLQRLENLDLSFGLSARGIVERERGNMPAAVRAFYKSIELEPGRTASRDRLAGQLTILGLEEEARKVAPTQNWIIAFMSGDFRSAGQLAREDLEAEPDSVDALFSLFSVFTHSGDAEAAMPVADRLWERFANHPSELGEQLIWMSWAATKTEHIRQASVYRDAGAKWLQTLVEAGAASGSRFRAEARMSMLDGRYDDAISAISRAIDHGSSWSYFLAHPIFDPIRSEPRFQAQVSRINDRIADDRMEVLGMLCGPDTILDSWQPAPGTCELYHSAGG